MDIKFKIDPDRITLNDQIAMEEAATLTSRQLRDLLARYLVDDNGDYLVKADGIELAGSLTKTQQVDAITKFGEAVNEATQRMLPLATSAS